MCLRSLTWIAVLSLAGCTSLGHGGREAPKIARATGPITEIGIDGDDNELAVALERLLEERGVTVRMLATPKVRTMRADKEYTYDEVQTRFVVRVRSEDLDTCLPEGSRQMNFYLAVTDFQERRRVFLMNGTHGCRDSIVEKFARWLSEGNSSVNLAPKTVRDGP